MKYYYFNRVAMAVLVALLLFFGTRTLINIATEEHPPEKPGFEVAGDEKPHGKEEKPAEEPGGGGAEILPLMASADAKQGEAGAGLCKVCHTFDNGGASLIGPNLYNSVGAKIASREGFNYSPALKAKEGDWTYENLDVWLANPQAFAPGTSMAFPGIPDIKKRADMIAFLRSNSDDPVPLPEVSADEPAEAAPAEEPAAEEPAAKEEPEAVTEETTEDTIVVPPTVSEDAPSEPHMGEDASPSQPQPVYPDESASDESADEAMEETMETIVVPPTVSGDAPSEPHMGEDASPSQPQPVYPDEAMDDSADSSDAMAPAGDDGLSSQPQPVYPDGAMDEGSDSSMAPAPPGGANDFPSQPQPVYPDGKPDGL